MRSCRNWWSPGRAKSYHGSGGSSSSEEEEEAEPSRGLRGAMPLSRHTVRNEFALGGRDLYRAADQHDPEAVLDGVAMAGLVGVLRQLGDLAEYVRRTIPVLPVLLSFVRLEYGFCCSRLNSVVVSAPVAFDSSIFIFLDELLMSCISNCCVMTPGPIAFALISVVVDHLMLLLCYEQNGRFSNPFSFLRNGR